jgi:hypoxanthine phosphoribosyltransferase
MKEIVEIVAAVIAIVGAAFSVWSSIHRKRFAMTMNAAVALATIVLEKIERDGWRPNVVVGIGRSGAIWGGWLAGNLGSVPIYVIDKEFEITGSGRRVVLLDCERHLRWIKTKYGDHARLLVVEGATTLGTSLIDFERSRKHVIPEAEHRTAALYVLKGAACVPNYFGTDAVAPWPERFPWHYRPVYKRFLHGKVP